jgi:hypothetical protein
MSDLDFEQQELIFDYCIGLSDPADVIRAQELIASDIRAAELRDTFQEALAPLTYLPPELCPEDLANRTIRRLSELPPPRTVGEQTPARVIRPNFLRRASNTAGVVVTAAAVVFIIGVAMRASNLMRHRYHNQMCRQQLSDIYRALDLYTADYEGALPVVARAEGSLWHRIGDQTPQAVSNTRPLFLLLAHGYTDRAEDFICCSRALKDIPHLKRADFQTHRDFPSRRYVTYSYRLMPHPKVTKAVFGARPLLADMNPHFETLLLQPDRERPLRFDRQAAGLNSLNHKRRGQNILSGDGHAHYARSRFIEDESDDIYTLENHSLGGCRNLPTCLDDAFLAP